MTKTTFLRKNLNNKLWPKIKLVIIYIKNICPKNILNDNSLYYIQQKKQFNIQYFCILDLMIYIFV